MNRKKKKKIRNFLFFIISIMIVVSIIKHKDNGLINNKENTAQASTENRNKVNTSEKILTGKTIVIDAGHGGEDIGASGQNERLKKM